jgi:hypothetical protein
MRTAAIAALVLAVLYLGWRGVSRGVATSEDLAVTFAAARAWLLGHNPYDAGVLNREISLAGGADVTGSGLLDLLLNVYFPTSLPLYALIAFVAWPEAKMLALAVNLGALVFIALGAVRLLGWPRTSSRALTLTAFLLVLAPVITSVTTGQTGIVATAAIVAAMLLERSGHSKASGAMFGLATVVKIQIGLPFVAYLFWRRRWGPAVASCLVVAGATGLSMIRMQVASTPWLGSWLGNLAWVTRPGGINDPGMENAGRVYMINLQYPLSTLIADGTLVQLMTFGAVGMAAVTLIWLRRGRDSHPDLLALAVVGVLALLVTYHRHYDAVLLVLPIVWACSVIGTPQWLGGAVVLLLCANFILPFQSIAWEVELSGLLPAALTDSAIWNVVVLAQHVWALALMSIALLVAAALDRRRVSAGEISEAIPVQ